jgi:hypothetical protein
MTGTFAALVLCTLGADDEKLHPLAADVVLDGKVVIATVQPGAVESLQIAWESPRGQSVFTQPMRVGRHAYDPRSHADWRGRAWTVSSNVKDAELVLPSFADEIDIFLAPEPWLPSTVNVLGGHRIFDWSWDLVLLALAGLGAVASYAAARRRIGAALLAGFLLAWALLDVRTMYDHAALVRTGGTLPGLSEAKAFADRAAPAIGASSWALDAATTADVLAAHYFGYAFADQPRREPGEAAYQVTLTPAAGDVVVTSGPYALVRRGPP